MWGEAIYFAVNAAYSCPGYSHKVSDGTHKVFLAEVSLGKEIELASTPTLKEPPKGYNSVRGFTNNSVVHSVVHMIY